MSRGLSQSASPEVRVAEASKIHHRISPEAAPLRERLVDLIAARELGVMLFRRELQVRYKQTALGIAWVILQPLVPALIFAAVLGVFAGLPSSGTPYVLFALTGLVLYSLFSNIVARAGGSLLRDAPLIGKVYFPRAVLPIATGLAGLVDFMVGFVVLVVLAVLLDQPVTMTILVVPLVIAATCLLAMGVALAVAGLGVRYRDAHLAVPFALQLLLYGSPVLYSLEILPPQLSELVGLNPLVPLIETFRWAVLGTPGPTGVHILLGLASAALLVVVGLGAFGRATRDLADVI